MRRVLALALLGPAACGSPATDPAAVEPASAPLLGQDDRADHDCRVVLRSAADGAGVVDVAAGEPGDPVVLYRTAGEWWSAPATAADGAPAGFRRFTFALDAGGADVELIPALVAPDGARLFDHNRHADDLENYRLAAADDWRVAEAPQVCAGEAVAAAVLSFDADGGVRQDGALLPGGTVTIQYALERLGGCHSTHNGFPAWDLRAFVRFVDANGQAGEAQEASVRAFEAPMGVPHDVAHAVPATFRVPAGAAALEAWFVQEGFGSGTPCQAWDSNEGRNYRFEVLTPPGWMGDAVVNVTRAGGGPCDGGKPLDAGFAWDEWARERAVSGNVCFQVWKDGVTDHDDPELWRRLDVMVHYRFGDGPFTHAFLPALDRRGHNARYAFDVAALDPFRNGCAASNRLEFYFTVNGANLAGPDGAPFVGTYDAPGNCP
jgi:hypothetical protein